MKIWKLYTIIIVATIGIMIIDPCVAQTIPHSPLHEDYYQHWKQPGTNMSCCNARVLSNGEEIGDCESTNAELFKDAQGEIHWKAWLRQETRWIEIPDERIIREHNPTAEGAHLCWNYGQVLCFVPPATGG